MTAKQSLSARVLAASAGRDRVIDAVKAGALLLVVVGHNLAWTTTATGAVETTLDAVPWMFGATWVLQTVPLFFFAAGASLPRLRGAPDGLARRTTRLVAPTVPLILLAVLLAGIIPLVASPDLAGAAGVLPTQLLWFVGVYLLVLAAWPAVLRVRSPWQVMAALTVIGAVDAARVLVAEPVGWLNLLLVWGLLASLGARIEQWRALRPRTLVAIMAACVGGAVLLVVLGPYSPALISTAALPGISNLAPPTLVLALAGIAQVCVLMLAWRGLARLLARDRAWVPVAVFSAAAMEVFLYHVVVMAALIAAVMALGLAPPALRPAWWGLHLLVLAIDLAVVYAAAPMLRRAAAGIARLLGGAGRRTHLSSELSRRPRWWHAVTAIAGLALLLVSEGGLARVLQWRTVVVVPYLPAAAVAVVLACLAATAGVRSATPGRR